MEMSSGAGAGAAAAGGIGMAGSLGIGAGIGLLKGLLIDGPAAERQRKLQAATARFSPWTGLKPEPVKEADPAGSAATFGVQGMGIQQSLQNSAAQQKLLEAQSNWLNAGGAPQYTAAMNAVPQNPNFTYSPDSQVPTGYKSKWLGSF